MRRREFIAALGAATLPVVAFAQQHVPRVGVLIQYAESDAEGLVRLAAFRDGLQELGWKVGDDLQIDYRWGVSDEERAGSSAAELLALAPDVILANSTWPLRAAQQATRTVPIVFTTIVDPVEQGYVASLAHPGGNTTGFSYLEVSVGGKWMQLLKEIAPRITHVACMFNPQRGPYSEKISRFAREAAQKLEAQYVSAPVFEPAQIESVMTALAHEPNGGLIVSPDAFTVTHRDQIIALVARYRLPAIYSERNFAVRGGLISYGADYIDHFRRAASYVDRILRGAKPADLPVQQPSKFYLVINLKTAKALGLQVPSELLAHADEVIE
jgi:putative tryptophan/tyrosine transport system substrate-binding protein